MKKLKIYTENSEFVIENINSFGYGTKYFFLTENEMKEFLNPYITVIDQYKLEISGELWGMILNYLSDKKVSEQ